MDIILAMGAVLKVEHSYGAVVATLEYKGEIYTAIEETFDSAINLLIFAFKTDF